MMIELLLESSTAYDISITVRVIPNAKVFNAHSSAFVSRSSYFATSLFSDWSKTENGIKFFKRLNIASETFEVFLWLVMRIRCLCI